MNDSKAWCRTCDEWEPEDWDYEKNGLWVCKCNRTDSYKVEDILKKVEELYSKRKDDEKTK